MKTSMLILILVSVLAFQHSWSFEEYECKENLSIDTKGLIQAAINGDVGSIMCIIDSDDPDVNVNSADQYGRTALFWAAFNAHDDAVRALITR